MKLELKAFQLSESVVEDFFDQRKNIGVLIMGHTHDPTMRTYSDGTIFINTGTWIKMHYLDFDKQAYNYDLTYAQINVKKLKIEENEVGDRRHLENLDVHFNVWKGKSEKPYREF